MLLPVQADGVEAVLAGLLALVADEVFGGVLDGGAGVVAELAGGGVAFGIVGELPPPRSIHIDEVEFFIEAIYQLGFGQPAPKHYLFPSVDKQRVAGVGQAGV